MTDKIKCPKCGSDQITSQKKGFSGKKAVAGAVLTGGVGLLAGTIGSNKIKIHCLNCGNSWMPGAQRTTSGSHVNTDNGLEKMAFIKLYKAGSIEAARATYRKMYGVSEETEVSDETLKAIYESESKMMKARGNAFLFLLAVIVIIIFIVVIS